MSYPPDHHVMRDLRPWTERTSGGSRSYLDVVPEMCTRRGVVRAGVLATLVDMAGGDAAVRAARPNWVATSDLVLHVIRPVVAGVVCAAPRMLRKTRSTIVLEVDLSHDDEAMGLATMTFAVLTARDDVKRMGTGADEARTDFGLPGSCLRVPIDRALGVRIVDAPAGVLEVALTPYVGNSLGALQGGVVAMVLELGAEALVGSLFDADVTTLDLAINYLSLVKVGPARTGARVLRVGANEALVRVELHDMGNQDRLCTVATVLVTR